MSPAPDPGRSQGLLDPLDLIRELAPLRRDLISDGYDDALDRLRRRFPLTVHRFPTGQRCWTWRVPEKWSCDEAWIETLAGDRLVDQARHPLHVGSYSAPVDRVVPRGELLEHLHFHPHLEAAAPFLFHYYQDTWSFGCGQAQRTAFASPTYRVRIRSRREPGELKVGEWVLPGASDDSIVLCGHLCHPAQANDGLSGVVTGLAVMERLAREPRRRYTYRLLIGPETIGSVAWLSRHEALIPRLKGGLFLDMTGVDLPPALQLSYAGNTELDRCWETLHLASEPGAWSAPYRGVVGNDERQFNAPGVRVPMLSYARAHPWGHPYRPYPEYHSSADDLSAVSAAALERSRDTVWSLIQAWDAREIPVNRFKGEVFLSGYNLAVDRHRHLTLHRNMLRIMDCIDGTQSTAAIAARLDLPLADVRQFIDRLCEAGLVEVPGRDSGPALAPEASNGPDCARMTRAPHGSPVAA